MSDPAQPVAVGTTYAGTPASEVPSAPEPPAPAPEPSAPAAPPPAAPSGDPGLDLAREFISNAGIKDNDPALEAAREGDFSLVEAKLAALGDKAKGYEKFVALAKQAWERHTAQIEQQNAAVQSIVHQACGGEAGWAQVQAWAGQQASPEEKEQINAAFAAGGVQAKAAAQYLAEAYRRAGQPGYREPKGAVKPDAAGGNDGVQPLSAKAYATEVQKLLATSKGRDITTSTEYQQLQQRRLAARRAGH